MARKPFKFSRIARIYELIWQNQIFRMQHETCASGRLNISVSGNKVANKKQYFVKKQVKPAQKINKVRIVMKF